MNLSKQEAQESLTDIENVISQTRKAIARSGASFALITWGVIWVLGFSGTQFLPKIAGPIWLMLDFIGFVATWMKMRKSAHQQPANHRVLWAWLVLAGYMTFWVSLFHSNGREMIAFVSTLPLCIYVICGLWFGRFWIWLGLIVTAFTIMGYLLFPVWFPLWMAIAGGGSLIVSGLYILKFWK